VDVAVARSLASLRRWGHTHFSFDTPGVAPAVRRGVAALVEGGFPLHDVTFYVLVGYNTTPEEDMARLELLDELKVQSFVMPYDRRDPYQRRLARWCNHKATYRITSFADYRR